MSNPRWYIGAACDRAFVQHTAVMLTSLAVNGDVPDAQILVASFGLTHDDQEFIRSHLGHLADKLTFVDIDVAALGGVLDKQWQHHYPPAVLGRLFLPTIVREPNARILTLDSDMIVNVSVRPLFELVFDEGYVAAIHDTPRLDDSTYFNSGIMVIDVDAYNGFSVGKRCLEWLAAQRDVPSWPDQDALNTIVGHKWHRLERHWNWAYCGPQFGDEPLALEHYERAHVAHFTGQTKPWRDDAHPGRPLYNRYLRIFHERRALYEERRRFADGTFLWTAAELFLGDATGSAAEVDALQAASDVETLRNIVGTERFVANLQDVGMVGGREEGRGLDRYRRFALERLPLSSTCRAAVRECDSRSTLLTTIVHDEVFKEKLGISGFMSAMFR